MVLWCQAGKKAPFQHHKIEFPFYNPISFFLSVIELTEFEHLVHTFVNMVTAVFNHRGHREKCNRILLRVKLVPSKSIVFWIQNEIQSVKI